ncbi:hypothetical protein [Vibrio splendidus]|uniref:hypothetical protein n=1 Tax=Vibrio splendidus TaxID=29497 RepID=UPI000D35F340|nr:hypothetical protein [Vibrio splendidus]PTO72801.1 hypothetical protein CWN81_11775 [Vibrio splendidus]
MKLTTSSLAIATTVFSLTAYANTTFTGNLTDIDYSNDIRETYDVIFYMSDIKPKTTNPWGIGFTPEKSAELIGKCSEGMYLNKKSSKNFHTILSAVMSSKSNNNKIEITVENSENCLVTEVSTNYST